MKSTLKVILIVFLIIGLLVPLFDGGRTKKAEKKKYGGKESAPRHWKSPSGPRDELPPRETRGIKRFFQEAVDALRYRARPAKRARVEENLDDLVEGNNFQSLPLDVETLERKWQAVLEFQHLRDLGMSTNEAVDEIGERFGVGTGRNVRLLAQYAEERGSLVRKIGSGAPRTVSNRPDIIEFFEEKAKEFEYVFTYEVMANVIKEKFGVGSTETVKRVMELLEYTKTRRVIRPFLTEAHRQERLKWAKEWVNFDFFDEDVVVVHIDEKNFYAFSNRAKISYLPPGVDPKPLYALSKTQIPWVMFLAAVAAPREDREFDGKIGLWHVGEEKVAQRRSKFHEKEDVYMVNINMNGVVFVQMMEENVIPAIIQKCQWAKKVIVQLDSAGGHRIGETLDILNKIGKKSKPRIEFRTQPTRSPDTNVLDLGIWNSMKSRVVEVRYDRTADSSMNQRIIEAVMDMWEKYDSAKLNNIFITLTAVLKEIEEHHGGNSFKQPHTIKDHL
jgi:transposase